MREDHIQLLLEQHVAILGEIRDIQAGIAGSLCRLAAAAEVELLNQPQRVGNPAVKNIVEAMKSIVAGTSTLKTWFTR